MSLQYRSFSDQLKDTVSANTDLHREQLWFYTQQNVKLSLYLTY
jgi:hypothetical protein